MLLHWRAPWLPSSVLAMLYAAQLLTAVGASALRAHGQDGCCDECIRGERTALRQAVSPNGASQSSTVSLTLVGRSVGKISTVLTGTGRRPTGQAPRRHSRRDQAAIGAHTRASSAWRLTLGAGVDADGDGAARADAQRGEDLGRG